MADRGFGKNRRKTEGFTLAEVLLVVGILVILLAFSFIGITHYQRKLKLMEMDSTAREVFIAAQNRMSTLEADGTLELLEESALGERCTAESDGSTADKDVHVYRFLVHNAGESIEQKSALSYLLPFGAVDEAVRTDGNYRIEYDETAKTIVNVYYSKTASFLGGGSEVYRFSADGSDAAALRKAAQNATLRMHFDGSEQEAVRGAIVGYYGGESRTVPTGTIRAASLSVENGARLLLHITLSTRENTETRITVKGKDSGQECRIALGSLNAVNNENLTAHSLPVQDGSGSRNQNFYIAKCAGETGAETAEYLLCLDSVTENGAHFTELFPTLTAGEDIEISVVSTSTDGYALEAAGNTVNTNSLFASVGTESFTSDWAFDESGMGSLAGRGSRSGRTAYIENIRHLENLDPSISGLPASGDSAVASAVQTEDLVYTKTSPVSDYDGQLAGEAQSDSFVSEIRKYALGSSTDELSYGRSLTIYGLNGRSAQGYYPIQNSALLSYDGKGNAIMNFYSGTAISLLSGESAGYGQGIFAGISGQKDAQMVSIRNLKLSGCCFENSEENSASGALIGLVGNSHQLSVQGIETENCRILSSGGTAGGLIGQVSATSSDSAAVKLYVNACGILGEYGEVRGGNAGGLIGVLQGSNATKLANSTASIYVSADSAAGGFLGSLSGTAGISYCYVGGHTVDGRYAEKTEGTETKDVTSGQGRWNVLSQNGSAGGFLGRADSASVLLTGCYSTASVSGGSAGSFLGGGDGLTLTRCYASGRVNGENSLPENITAAVGKGSDYPGKAYAKPYDATLSVNGGNPHYPYMTTEELYGQGGVSTKYGRQHIGDFCEEAEQTNETILRFANGPRLYAEVFTPLQEGTNYMSMVLKDEDGNTDSYSFTAVKNSDGSFTLNRTKGVNSGEHSDYDSAYLVNVGGTDYLVYRILLDDISVANEHFSENSKNLRVGSAITGYAVSEEKPEEGWYTAENYLSGMVDTNTVAQLLTAANADLTASVQNSTEQYRTAGEENAAAYDTDNSLFGRDSSFQSGQANIRSIRHLENLDHYVSYLGNPSEKRTADDGFTLPGSGYSKAVQHVDLDWDQYLQAVKRGDETPAIYRPKSSTAITSEGYFYGIQNLLLTEYDGGNHSISNLRIAADKNDWNSAGLFAAVSGKQSGGFTIRRLRLRNAICVAYEKKSGGKNCAAALVGYHGSCALSIQNVVIEGTEIQSKMDAGGLVGYSDGGSLSISNVAVYEGERQADGQRPHKLLVYSEGVSNKAKYSSESASAGGLIGRSDNTAVSISGASVYGENAVILACGSGKSESNDYTDDSAGGLVGTIHDGSLTIDSCGVTAYVYAPSGDCAGGIVGDFSCSGSIRRSYAAALSGTDTGSDGSVKSVFRNASAVDVSGKTVSQPGGYNVYGHLAVGGIVGYCNWNVEITNCFSTASVGINASSNYSYRKSMFDGSDWNELYFIGGLMGQLGTGSSSEKVADCYLAGQAFDPSGGSRNIFIGAVLGYSGNKVGAHFYRSDTNSSVSCLTGMSFLDDNTMRFIGGQSSGMLTRTTEKSYQNSKDSSSSKIFGLWHVERSSLAAADGSTAQATEVMNQTSLGGQNYPYLDYTHLYSPDEILRDNTEIENAPLRYYGDWCLERAS